MDLQMLIATISSWIISLPLMLFVIGVSVACTFAFRFVQFRYFFQAWKEALAPSDTETTGDMTPLQAFINTLSAGLGNGSIAGVAAAVYAGGPGSLFWIVFFGFILMAVRFAEVYTSTLYGAQNTDVKSTLGGPMLYLKDSIGGSFLSYIYAFSCLLFGLLSGNAAQTNAIALSLETTWGIAPWITAVVLGFVVAYIVLGGSARIISVSEKIVPIKVVVFFVSTLLILLYHFQSLFTALHLIVTSAVAPHAIMGGALGFSIQQAVRHGMARSIMATESGLGTAAIMFGFTGSKHPMRSGLMGMLSTFMSTLVCFIVGLCIVVSGVWNSGLTSTELTISSFNTVFGSFGGWIVSFLAISFGLGVLVAYGYVARAAWLFLTKGRWVHVFTVLYCLAAVGGALTNATVVFNALDIPLGILLFINLFGLLQLLPRIRKHVLADM